jgi:hypothetical protein
MNVRVLIACIAILAAATVVAAPPQVGESQEIAKSFAWKGSALPGDKEAARQLLYRRVEEKLASVGYRPAGEGVPDMYVAAYVALRNPDDTSAGSATLVVDLVHAASGVLIWRSFDSDISGTSLLAARFSNLATYAWKEIPTRPGVEPPYTNTDRAIRNALEAGLLFRDWAVAPDQASAGALVTYRIVARGADVKAPMKATLTVELINPWSNKLLWKGEEAVPIVKADKVEDAAIDAVVALAKQVPRPQGTPVPAPK